MCSRFNEFGGLHGNEQPLVDFNGNGGDAASWTFGHDPDCGLVFENRAIEFYQIDSEAAVRAIESECAKTSSCRGIPRFQNSRLRRSSQF
jgi:hypothetical protein